MGQAAFLTKNFDALSTSFYASIPGKLLDSSGFIVSTLLKHGYKFFSYTSKLKDQNIVFRSDFPLLVVLSAW